MQKVKVSQECAQPGQFYNPCQLMSYSNYKVLVLTLTVARDSKVTKSEKRPKIAATGLIEYYVL